MLEAPTFGDRVRARWSARGYVLSVIRIVRGGLANALCARVYGATPAWGVTSIAYAFWIRYALFRLSFIDNGGAMSR